MESTGPVDRFSFHVEDLIAFIFPSNLQHPLAAARLIAFAMYGPLQEGTLRSGRQGVHVLAEYELEVMCLQIEKEDILQIYLHRPRDMGLLSSAEQEAIINQADAHLKREKGKAMLPRIGKEDVRDLLKHLPRDAEGRVSFHEAQKVVEAWRRDRVKRYKLVYPNLVKAPEAAAPASTLQGTVTRNMAGTKPVKSHALTVSSSVAPVTMFQKMKGLTNADLIEQTTQRIGKHGFKISNIDHPCEAMASNVRLLRDIPPRFEDNPFPKRQDWNDTSNMGKVGLGSMVQGTGGSSTWRRKYTSY